MDIKFWLIIGAFYLIRAFLKNKNADQKKNSSGVPVPKKKKTKNIEDIFGDFMDEVNKKANPKPVYSKPDDSHKAEDDSNKKLDWQEITYSKFGKKKEELLTDNYRKPKTSIPVVEIENLDLIEEDDNDSIIEEIDLRKAVIYKEILERKYFSI